MAPRESQSERFFELSASHQPIERPIQETAAPRVFLEEFAESGPKFLAFVFDAPALQLAGGDFGIGDLDTRYIRQFQVWAGAPAMRNPRQQIGGGSQAEK